MHLDLFITWRFNIAPRRCRRCRRPKMMKKYLVFLPSANEVLCKMKIHIISYNKSQECSRTKWKCCWNWWHGRYRREVTTLTRDCSIEKLMLLAQLLQTWSIQTRREVRRNAWHVVESDRGVLIWTQNWRDIDSLKVIYVPSR